MFRAFRSIGRFIASRIAAARASSSRAFGRRAARGRGGARLRAAAASEELIEEAASLVEEAEAIILNAYVEAITTMVSMVGNAGQSSVMQSRVIPAFEEAYAESDPENGWPQVDIGEYMAFMGEIVSEGNGIMEAAYNDAASLLDEAAEILG